MKAQGQADWHVSAATAASLRSIPSAKFCIISAFPGLSLPFRAVMRLVSKEVGHGVGWGCQGTVI